jgi:hypothetical protein
MTDISIRPAASADFEFVSALMDTALAPYYGGDHIQHARRIFDAHIEKHLGIDNKIAA